MAKYKIIKGYENYRIYDSGLVYSEKSKIYLKKHIRKDGYEAVGLYNNGIGKKHLVHRLVAINFLEDQYFKGAIVNHKDGNKTNNTVSNLEWCTYKYNAIHAFNNGLCNVGENHHCSKLSNADVIKIKDLYKNTNYNQNDLSEMFSVGQDQISRIINNKRRRRG